MAILEWTTLIVCGVVLLVRVPDAIQGRNRIVFGILLLATLCSFLSVPGPYEAIDRLLGGWNATDLIRRYLIFATVLLVGLRVTTGLAAVRGHRLVAGTTGRWALGLSCLAVAVTFFLMDTRGSSAGLLGVSDSGGRNAGLVPYYAAAGRTYPAFVSLFLMPPLLATVRSRLPRLVRIGALLMLIGALCAALSVPASLAPDAWDLAQYVVNYAAVLGYVLGLALFWFSGLMAQRPRSPRAALHGHGLHGHGLHRNGR
ncbi:hypothetical protein [Pseudarthrobacter albicanus]|uniref:hypothetical protein n=1 Tax=Pseudarthrobacter albicanus TaxID=2823873 RepID=UPI001BA7ED4D|nr:hypothetical protein [Pseudarthrobacter albicanus]